jgi:mannose-6-phosphate isomerase
VSLYPLKFHPRLLPKMWGGRKLQTILGKPLPTDAPTDSPTDAPPDAPIGESWELFDFPPGILDDSPDWISSVIANGPLAGRTLHWAISEFGRDLMGDVPLLPPHGQFPLLVKYLDAAQDLSVQVHPDEAYAAAHPDAHLKTEAWYIVQADPNARILKGLAPNTTRQTLELALDQGTVEQHLKSIPAREGHCVYLPSGTVHALGAGILAAEVQTPSDTTYRLYDFNRIDPATHHPRPLHIHQALDCIDFSGARDRPQPRSHVASYFTTVTRLITSPFFKLEKVRMIEGIEEPVPYDQPVIWMMLHGRADIRVDDLKQPIPLTPGDTLLLPATMKNPIIKTIEDCAWLEATFPTKPEVS